MRRLMMMETGFPFKVTPYYAALMDPSDPSDPLSAMVTPDGRAQPNDRAEGDIFSHAPAFEKFEQDVIRGVTFRGLSDRRTWRFAQHPRIFDSNNQREPTYAAIVDALLHRNHLED